MKGYAYCIKTTYYNKLNYTCNKKPGNEEWALRYTTMTFKNI